MPNHLSSLMPGLRARTPEARHADNDNLELHPTDRSNRSPSLNLGPGSLQRGLPPKQGRRKSSKPPCHAPQTTATHTCRHSPDLITQHITQRLHPLREPRTTALMLPSQNPSSQMQPQTQESRFVRTSHFRKPNVRDGRARAHLFASRKCNTSTRSSSRCSRAAMA
jgi:hypothetical protein